ncbi:MAG: aminopeptidase P family protein [Chloroflexi bacterium]|nr:aminopeptidase P family protein [Chloroflexota bacterium]
MSKFLRDMEPLRPSIDWQRLQELRWQRTRELMAQEGLHGLLVNSFEPVIYLTSWPRWQFLFTHRYAALFARDGGEPVIFAPEADAPPIVDQELFDDVRALPTVHREWPEHFSRAMHDYGLDGGVVGIDPNMLGWLYEQTKQQVKNVSLADAGPFLARLRAVKNPEEIKAYEHTLSIIEGATNTAVRLMKESWGRYSEIDIVARASEQMLRRGCTRTNLWLASGENATPLKRYWTEKMVRAGEFALIDGGGSFNGFRAEIARTVWGGGPPSDEQQRAYRAVYDAHQAMRKVLRPGTMTAEVDKACVSVIKEAGFWEHYGGYPYTGHGIGITQEPPWITATDLKLNVPLEVGMIVNLEPAIFKKGLGGIRIEDTYLITEDGYRVMSRVPYEEDLLG